MSIQFREAQSKDSAKIFQFQLAMALETEGQKLQEDLCQKGVEAVFQNPSLGSYYVCESGPKIIGSLLITHEWSDWRNGMVWWIQSVYIEPEFRGKKIFSQFYQFIKSKAQANPQIRGLRLYVDQRNTHAQSVYKSIGMDGEHYKVFEWMKTNF